MAESQNNRVCLVQCDNCRKVVEAQWSNGFFKKGWRVPGDSCPHCKEPLNVKNIATTVCPNCGRLVQESVDGTCINCHKKTYHDNSVVRVKCPECGVTNLVPKNQKENAVCTTCGAELTSRYIDRYLQLENAEPESISLPTAQEMAQKKNAAGKTINVIWKHPANTFPYKSRLIVSEGTFALLFQNGKCDYPLDAGSYLLEETSLSMEQKFDEALKKDDIVFRTDVFCVVRKLGMHHIGASSRASTVKSQDGRHEYSVGGNADFSVEITDAKAFAELVNFREIGTDDLFYVPKSTTDPQQPGILLSMLRDAFAVGLTESVLQFQQSRNLDLTNLDLHRNELTALVSEKMTVRLDPYGLRVDSITNPEYFTVETEKTVGDNLKEKIREENRKQILREARDQFSWTSQVFTVNCAGSHDLTTSLSLTGNAMLRIDEDYFFRVPAIESLAESETRIASNQVAPIVKKLFQDALNSYAPSVLQRMLNESAPHDIRDLDQYLPELSVRLQSALASSLRLNGLEVYALTTASPNLNLSPALIAFYSLEKKQKEIQRYVETTFSWYVRDILIHVKDMPEYSASVTYDGACRFRVLDPDRFFRLSEIQGFIEKTPPVTEQDIQSYYKGLISTQFGQYLQIATQQFIDTFDPDIRYLGNLTGQLTNFVTQQLDPLVNQWGLRIESLTVRPLVAITPGSVLDANLKYLEGKARNEIDLLKHKDDNRHEVDVYEDDAKKKVAMGTLDTNTKKQLTDLQIQDIQTDSALRDAETEEELRQRKREERIRVYDYELRQAAVERDKTLTKTEIINEGEIKELRDRMAAEQKTRDFNELYEDFRRRKKMDEEAINKQLDEYDLRQDRQISHQIAWIQGRHRMENMQDEHDQQREIREKEHDRAIADIQHKTGLDKAEFDRTLNGILHEIDSANLDWRRKLDEYNRLMRQMNFADTLDQHKQTADQARDEKLANAQASAQITGMQIDLNTRAQEEQLNLAAKQNQMKQTQAESAAELAERIARWAEDRKERVDTSAYNRQERRDILQFEHQMEDRREMVAQQLEILNAKFAQEQAKWTYEQKIADMNAEIVKLELQLDYFKGRDAQQSTTEQARIRSEEAVKTAEAKYRAEHEEKERQAEQERLKDQQQRYDSLMNMAAELYKNMAEIEKALSIKRMDVEQHKSDNITTMHGQDAQAAIAIAQQNNISQQVQTGLEQVKTAIEDKNGEKITKGFDLLLDHLRDLQSTLLTTVGNQKDQSSSTNTNTNTNNNDNKNKNEDIVKSLRTLTNSINELQKKIHSDLSNISKSASSRRCPNCNALMTGRFCSSCGWTAKPVYTPVSPQAPITPIAPICPSCGFQAVNGKCPGCGKPLP